MQKSLQTSTGPLNNHQKINIEMQVINGKDWPERSLTYLCRAFDNLKHGQNCSTTSIYKR